MEQFLRKPDLAADVSEVAPKQALVSGSELQSGMRLADSGREITKVISHGSDEVLVVLDDNTSRIFSRTESEVAVLEK